MAQGPQPRWFITTCFWLTPPDGTEIFEQDWKFFQTDIFPVPYVLGRGEWTTARFTVVAAMPAHRTYWLSRSPTISGMPASGLEYSDIPHPWRPAANPCLAAGFAEWIQRRDSRFCCCSNRRITVPSGRPLRFAPVASEHDKTKLNRTLRPRHAPNCAASR